MISLIIPVYNKAPFLKRCLDSVVNQTNTKMQVIMVDDASTDGSGEICDSYAEKYGWEVYHKKKNAGVSASRNFGMSKATGDYIAFLDADDALTNDAIEVMTQMERFDYNAIQFGQYRYMHGPNFKPVRRCAPSKFYGLDFTPAYTSMVWNKIYKKSFLDRNKIKFKEGMTFGEDELFNAECILANRGLFHAPQVLMRHYLDDNNSICRGGMCKEYLEGLDKELQKLRAKQKDPERFGWIDWAIKRNYDKDIFQRFGVGTREIGKYDIVYFLKDTPDNAELRYSLRSVAENLKHRKVWFYGGCPGGLKPDGSVRVLQGSPTKWQNVRNMMMLVCKNDNITEDFWLFNDDFFVLKPMSEDMPVQYDGTLSEKIATTEERRGKSIDWTRRLRKLQELLTKAGKPELNYAVHKPMLINRKKMLEVLEKYPYEPMVRALYGNYWELGGVDSPDKKVMKRHITGLSDKVKDWDFVSTSDASFSNGNIGEWLRDRFNRPSRFERKS
ncbi:glycosyltransferase family 2 protein [Candidatus Saccharibacteria bacterium]|nr:glycosyltransferase family 2 protein [Candidatus Saccharibacteria bacterium]